MHIQALASNPFEYAIYIYPINCKLKTHRFYEFSPFSQHAMHTKCILHSTIAIYAWIIRVDEDILQLFYFKIVFSYSMDWHVLVLVFGGDASSREPQYGGAGRCNCNQQLNMLFSIIYQIFAFNLCMMEIFVDTTGETECSHWANARRHTISQRSIRSQRFIIH